MAKEFLVASDSNASSDQIKRLLPAETVVIANDGHEIVSLLDQHPDIGFLMLDLESLRRNESILVSLLELAKAQVDYRERSLLLDVLFKQAPIGISLSFDSNPGGDTASDFVTINPMFAQITGWSEEEMISKGWASITHPDDLEADLRNYRRLQAGEIKSYTMEKRFIKPDGSVVWVDMIVAALKLFHEDIYDHLCMIKDITERKEIERILTENEHSKSMLLANLQGLAYRCLYDREWTMQYVSEGCLELTGYPAESLLNNKEISYKQLIAPEYQELLWNEWARILPLRMPFRYEYQIVTASGERKWVLEMGEGIYNSRGEAELLDGMIIDITEQKQTETTLKYRTEHDTLTGLYNRAYLESLLEVDARSLYRKKRALIAINLRDIVELTPYFGFHYTQDLIRKVSRGLRELCSDRYDLYHTYENRFTYYVRDCQGKDQVIEFLQQLVAKLEELLEDERVGAGIGVLEIEPDNELDANQLLKQLLIASERAQEDAQGGFHYSFFDAEMEAKIAREEAIKSELQRALSTDDEESLYLQFQPILSLKNDDISGFEALVRFTSQNYGLISPQELIPLAEKGKLMVSMGREIIRKALWFLSRLERHGFDSVYVSINISGIQIEKESFCEDLCQMIDEAHVNPRSIGLEITESILTDDYKNIEINSLIRELRDYGIRIYIDDFGTGYSSLARQLEINVNCLKIDKFFVDKLASPLPEKSLVREIISIAKRLGHESIAEGVEYEIQKRYLLDCGCDMIQGYLVSKPLSEQDALEFLRSRQNSASIPE